MMVVPQSNSSIRSSNKRIAKNAMYMYIRMLLIMAVTLYTSRVILQTLGESDFGTYNIVGGIVVLFTFINTAMTTGTQRHLSYELGKKNGDISTIFSACLNIHLWLSLIIFILSETVGLWFVNTQMNFPEGRMGVVNWIYQFSIFSCISTIIRAPYNAAIISYEKMSFYSYSGIIEASLKLAIVFLLILLPWDKLLIYGLLLFLVSVIILVWYILYCHAKLCGIKYKKCSDKTLYKHLLSFSGWSLFGSFANVCYQQGVNIVINIFFGVGLNAAVGIANQVNSAISTFVNSFQQALNPQLVQSEASKDRVRQTVLIHKSSKFSFFIMLILSYPLVANMDYVLRLWLGSYPSHTPEICTMILMGVLISSISGPLWVTIYATGNIKKYQIIVSSVALTVVPIVYIGGKCGMTPEIMFVVRALNYLAVLIVQMLILKNNIGLIISGFINNVIIPSILVLFSSISFYFIAIKYYFKECDGFYSFVFQSIVYIAILVSLIWIFGLTKGERVAIIIYVRKLIKI